MHLAVTFVTLKTSLVYHTEQYMCDVQKKIGLYNFNQAKIVKYFFLKILCKTMPHQTHMTDVIFQNAKLNLKPT